MERNEQLGAYYSQYANRINHLIGRKIYNPEEREDLVQDTFEKAVKYWGSFKEGGNFYAWIATIAMHTVTDRLRHDGVITFAPVDETFEVIATDPLPEQIVIQNELHDTIQEALTTLTPRRREVIQSYYLDEKPLSQISQEVGITRGGLKSTLSVARHQLEPLLKDYGKSTGA